MNLKSDAKVRGILAYDKFLWIIFIELLRQGDGFATKSGEGAIVVSHIKRLNRLSQFFPQNVWRFPNFSYLCPENINDHCMCTVRIKVDEAVMQRINPSLTSSELIGEWLQQQVDMLIEEYETPDMSVEELYHAIEQDVKAVYAD